MVERHSWSHHGIKLEMGLDDTCCGRCEERLDEIVGQLTVWHP
jgi:hypothetical protein